MSRIGRLPITIPTSTTVSYETGKVVVSGPKGKLMVAIPDRVTVATEDGKVWVKSDLGNLQGMVKTNINNAVRGVTEGWTRILELAGTGYRATVAGKSLQLALGFSHQVNIEAAEGIAFEVKENKITVSGTDKILVGQTAATIRGWRPADPYKAKGLKYEGEVLIKKAGKAAKAGATTK